MSKKKITSLVLVVALLGGGFFVYRNIFDWVRVQAEKVASESLGVDVGIGSLDVAFGAKTIRIKNISIDNPEGYGIGTAVKLGDIEVVADTLSRDKIVIKKVLVTDNEINLEMKGTQNNLNALSSGIKKGGAPKSESSAKAPTLNITSLVIDNTTLNVKSDLLGDQDAIAIPAIRLNNVGQNNNQASAVVAHVTAAVLNQALATAAGTGILRDVSKLGTDAVKGGLKTGADGVKKTLDGIKF